MNRLLLIDTFNYIHRAYYALPKTFKTYNGEPVNAVYGMTSMLINTLDTLKPTHVVAAYDDTTQEVFRSAEMARYKATRKPMEPDLESQLPKIEEVIDAFGIKRVVLPGYEADDIIGTIAKAAEKAGFEVVIVSNDRDVLQLLSSHIRIFVPDTSKEGGTFFGVPEFKAKYGFEPINMIDYKSLRGDASDNIPGVPGIGEKTGSDLIIKYATLENVYKHLSDISSEALRQKLIKGRESAIVSKKIATIICDLNLSYTLEDCRIKQVDRLQVAEVLRRYNFKSLLRRLGFEDETQKKKKDDTPSGQLSMI